MKANLQNSAVATGLEKISFHSSPKEKQCQRVLKLLHNCTPLQFSSVQLLSCVWLFATPWITACQASLSITISQSVPRLMFIESVMPSNHLILCRPLLLLPTIPPSIRVFSNESTLRMRWPCTHIHKCPLDGKPTSQTLTITRMPLLGILIIQAKFL